MTETPSPSARKSVSVGVLEMSADDLAWILTWNRKKVSEDELFGAVRAASTNRNQEYAYLYYSPNRPAADLFTSDEAFVFDRFVFTDELLPLERLHRHQLVPCSDKTWVEVAKQVYQAMFGETKSWTFVQQDEPGARLLSFEREEDGWYRAYWYTVESDDQEARIETLDECLKLALEGGYLIPYPPDSREQAIALR